MKARVKATGEIIEVHDCSADMYVEKFGEVTGRVYHITELDFDNLDSWIKRLRRKMTKQKSASAPTPAVSDTTTVVSDSIKAGQR